MSETRSVSKFRRKNTFYLLGLSSGILMSIFVVLDDIISLKYLTDPYILGAFQAVVGFVITVAIILLLHLPVKRKSENERGYNLGYFIDKNFSRFRFPKGKIGLYTLLAGLFSSGATIFYFILLNRKGSSVIMPFSQFVLIYLLIGEFITDKEKPAMAEIQSIAMIAVGVIIASLTGGSNGADNTGILLDILLVIGPFAIFASFYIYFQKKALTTKDKNGKVYDSINLRLWTLLIMTFAQSLVVIPSLINGGFGDFVANWEAAMLPTVFSVVITFASIVLYSRALTMGKMSIVRALRSISVVFTFPVVLIAGLWVPELLGIGFSDPLSITLKISGSILILIGVIALALSETKCILLAKVKQGVEIVPDELIKMKGVENFSHITGIYDLLINIKIRNLGKTLSLLEKSIAKIEWIETVTTHPIIKEFV